MSKSKQIWLTVASCIIVIGILFFLIVMTILEWDFSKLSTVSYEKNDYTISESYRDISIVASNADVEFIQNKNIATTIICYEETGARHSVHVNEGRLEVLQENEKKWYEKINIHFGNPKITVILPNACGQVSVKTGTGDVILPDDFTFDRIDVSVSTGSVRCGADTLEETKIRTSTGRIHLFDSHCGKLSLRTTTGNISVEKTYCEDDAYFEVSTGKTYVYDFYSRHLTSKGDTGDIHLIKVTPLKLSVVRSTGDVLLEECDASEIFVETDTGDVEGTILSEKIFETTSDTGKIEVSKTASGGLCKIATDTGDIKIFVKNK